MVSALTLLRTEDTYRSRDKWSYVLLAEELRRACAERVRRNRSERPEVALRSADVQGYGEHRRCKIGPRSRFTLTL